MSKPNYEVLDQVYFQLLVNERFHRGIITKIYDGEPDELYYSIFCPFYIDEVIVLETDIINISPKREYLLDLYWAGMDQEESQKREWLALDRIQQIS